MLMPQTLAIVTMTFPPERRGAAFGIWGAVAGLATIAGPTLGGLLVTAFDWRWIFFVNLPIGAAVLAVTFFIIPDLQPGRRHRFDIRGVTLASLALLAICYGLVEGQRYDWGTITSFVSIPLIIGRRAWCCSRVFLLVQKLRQDARAARPVRAVPEQELHADELGVRHAVHRHARHLPAVHHLPAVRARLLRAEGGPDHGALLAGDDRRSRPFLGRLTDKIGGKYILMSGLTLFAAGMGWAVLVADPEFRLAGLPGPADRGRPRHGRHVRADDHDGHARRRAADGRRGLRRAQHRSGRSARSSAPPRSARCCRTGWSASLTSQATIRSAGLPPQVRGPFVSGFRQAAASGLIGGAPAGSAAPAGTSPALAAQLRRLGAEVFSHGYVLAMRWTMVLPIAVVALAAASCLLLRSRAGGQDRHGGGAEPGQMAGTISSPGSSSGQNPGSSSGTAS